MTSNNDFTSVRQRELENVPIGIINRPVFFFCRKSQCMKRKKTGTPVFLSKFKGLSYSRLSLRLSMNRVTIYMTTPIMILMAMLNIINELTVLIISVTLGFV